MSFLELTQLTKTYGKGAIRAVDELSLRIEQGEFVVLVGSSGCGKSTTLRLVAGLETPTSGSIRLDGRTITHAPPAERNVAMVFQDFALYPHMTVFDNIAFPLKARKVPEREREERVRATASMLDISDLLDRKPPKLSGGQKQRVAIGRAIVRNPALFLMDEPLSNLDAKLRAQMRGELARLHGKTGATIVYVTHDQTEAMTLATKIVVMDQGRVQQIGTPGELYFHPRNLFTAAFIGSPQMNFLECRVDRGMLRFLDSPDGIPAPPGLAASLAQPRVVVGIRPENVLIECDTASPCDQRIADAAWPHEHYAMLTGRRLRDEIVGSDAYISFEMGDSVIVSKTSLESLHHAGGRDEVRLGLRREGLLYFDPISTLNITP